MFSASAIAFARLSIAFTGFKPIDVSWLKIKQSAPSKVDEAIS